MNNVDHPEYYQSDGYEAFDVGNAIKYLLRWDKNNGTEDIDKAIWYLEHLRRHLKEKKDKEEKQQKTGPTYDLEFPNGEKNSR